MQLISSKNVSYQQLVSRIGEEKIEKRYQFLHEEMIKFIQRMEAESLLMINERVLMHAVLEYYEDIEKVKNAHELEHTNSPKVLAYTSYWLLRRQPIQIITQNDEDEKLIFANEKFVLTFLTSYMMHNLEAVPLEGDHLKVFDAFLNSFFYYLKFRKPDAQAIEMILLSFHLGQIFPDTE